MNILIAGTPEMTLNYQNALASLSACFTVSLSVSDISSYDGLLLPGGNDIHPSFWGEEITASRKIDKELDISQFRLMDAFTKKQMPILGICKGIQMINVYFGGNISQHLEEAAFHEYRDADQIHNTHTVSDNFLTGLYGCHFVTNSAHHQGIHSLGQNLQVLQYADDGVIEGIAHTYLPIIGVQWHPERMCFSHARKDTADGSLLLCHFLELCSSTYIR